MNGNEYVQIQRIFKFANKMHVLRKHSQMVTIYYSKLKSKKIILVFSLFKYLTDHFFRENISFLFVLKRSYCIQNKTNL